MSLRIRRGSDAERLGVRFNQGELVLVTSSNTSRPAYKLYVGDGFTAGGKDILETSAGTNLVYNTNTGRLDVSGLTTDDIIESPTATKKFFTNELAQDAVAAMFANGTMTGIEFVYNDLLNKMDVTVTGGGAGGGIDSVSEDTNPSLGGNLNLNSRTINGTGNINITGNIAGTGTISATNGLGANLPLNGFNITGAGDIDITGSVIVSNTISAVGGLGANLDLNGYDIEGEGNIIYDGNFTLNGDISTIGNLFLNSGNLSVSGTINAIEGLGADLSLNSYNIQGFGDIDINGDISATGSGTFTSLYSSNVYTEDAGIGLQVFSKIENSFSLNHYAGTRASPAAILAGDSVGSITIKGYNGTDYIFSGAISAEWEDTANTSTTYPASKVSLVVGNNTGTPVLAGLSSNGSFSAPILQTGVYATTPSDTRPTGVKGMIIFNDTSGKFQGFDGSTWVDLS